ncbi:DUF2490 domain-containing protein [Zunongwangia sp.]|uniref:DUF2490 domain-containing protein n=1 Tax=Zunongwangia sp. TaxID=1965325 RepID=UPI003AA935C7
MKKVLLPLLLLNFLVITAQNAEDRLGSWTLLAGNHKIAEKWNIPTIMIYQTYDGVEDLHFVLARTGLGYQVTPHLNVTLGYDYFYSKTLEKYSVTGKRLDRLFEQFNYSLKYNKLKIIQRVRFEQNWSKKNHKHSYSDRFRYRLKLIHPITKHFFVDIFNEIFLNFEEPHFNQNRFSANIGYAFSPNYKMEVGYLRSDFKHKDYNRLRLAIIFKTDWTK